MPRSFSVDIYANRKSVLPITLPYNYIENFQASAQTTLNNIDTKARECHKKRSRQPGHGTGRKNLPKNRGKIRAKKIGKLLPWR